jgi:hypothetical protein
MEAETPTDQTGASMTMPTAMPPICSCGVFSIGLCNRCGDGVCALHSNRIGSMLTCFGCAPEALKDLERVTIEAAARQEQKVEERRERISRLPVMSGHDLVLYLRDELHPDDPEERGTREGRYTGAELARAAAKADLYRRRFLVREKAFLRPAQYKVGWPVDVAGGIQSDADTFHRSRRQFLDETGNLWEEISTMSGRSYSRSIEIICPANAELPAGTAGRISHYWKFYGRREKTQEA